MKRTGKPRNIFGCLKFKLWTRNSDAFCLDVFFGGSSQASDMTSERSNYPIFWLVECELEHGTHTNTDKQPCIQGKEKGLKRDFATKQTSQHAYSSLCNFKFIGSGFGLWYKWWESRRRRKQV